MVILRSWKFLIEAFGLMAWAYTFLFYLKDYVLTQSINQMSGVIDETFKLFTSIIGFIFLIMRIVQYRRESKIKNDNARLDLKIKKQKHDLEMQHLRQEKDEKHMHKKTKT